MLLPQDALSFSGGHAPDRGGVADFVLAVLDMQIRGLRGAALDVQQLEAGPLEPGTEVTPAAAATEGAAERALGDSDPLGERLGACPRERPGRDQELVVR